MAAFCGEIGPTTVVIQQCNVCARHPNCKDLHYCFNCSQVFCFDCGKSELESTNHQSHNTEPLQELLQQRQERLEATRNLINNLNQKHDTPYQLLQLENEQKTQLDYLNANIDEFADQLQREVELIRSIAKQTIASRAAEIWAANPEDARKQKIIMELKKLRDIQATIDKELQLRFGNCDEQCLLAEQKDIKISTEVTKLLQQISQIPDKSCYNLSQLQRELKDCMTQLQREFSKSKETILKSLKEPFPFPHPDQLKLLNSADLVFDKHSLVLPNDSFKWPNIKGIVPTNDKSDAIYIVDSDNSKIKQLDLKTTQLDEVFVVMEGSKLNGLANIGDDPLSPLFVTTEQMNALPRTVRLLFLRRSSTESLKVVQSTVLDEHRTNDAFFALWQAGSLFCAIKCSYALYQLCRSSGASQLQFKEKPLKHELPEMVLEICGLQMNGEPRLVASFCDSSLRVYKVSGTTLFELQLIKPTCRHRILGSLIGLPGGSVIAESRFDDEMPLKDFKYGIACYASQPDGTLAAPKRLHTEDRWFGLKFFLPPTDFYFTNRLVADLNENLCLYTILSP